jgi:hypothetical protein
MESSPETDQRWMQCQGSRKHRRDRSFARGGPTESLAVQEGTITLVPPHQFALQIEALRQSTTIHNDADKEVPFEGETKDEFIRLVQEAYPVAKKMAESMNETGSFLSEVRRILKPKKLFLTWMAHTGFPRRSSYNTLLVHERFGDKLPQFTVFPSRTLRLPSAGSDRP